MQSAHDTFSQILTLSSLTAADEIRIRSETEIGATYKFAPTDPSDMSNDGSKQGKCTVPPELRFRPFLVAQVASLHPLRICRH